MRLVAALLVIFLGSTAAQAASNLSFENCSLQQQTDISHAAATAVQMLGAALDQLNEHNAEKYLIAWFGDEEASDTVASMLTAVRDRLQSPVTLVIRCEREGCEHNLVSYAMPNHISLCPDFFQTKPDQGPDSQFGNIIHELTHLLAGSKDAAYGLADTRKLAYDSPDRAIRNADSFQYFVEAVSGRLPNGDRPYSQSNSCHWAFDGHCDIIPRGNGNLCAPGTDTFDCTRQYVRTESPRHRLPLEGTYFGVMNPDDSCADSRNGICDEVGRGGSNACKVGTDITDCRVHSQK